MYSNLLENSDSLLALIFSIVLIFARLQAFFYTSPIFTARSMSRIIRYGLMISIAIVAVPPVYNDVVLNLPSFSRMFSLLVKELLLGFMMGIVVWLPIRGLEFAGAFLDTQRGSTMAQDLDVIFGSQTTPSAIFLAQIFSGYFFATGGMLLMQDVIFDSLVKWPPHAISVPMNKSSFLAIMELAGGLLVSALLIVFPIAGLMFFADIVVAFLAKSAPSLNALTLGMPIKSAVLLFMLLFYIDIVFPFILHSFVESIDVIDRSFESE
ncbi:flagellar biosynthetic protein FliR [Ruegeria sp. SCPT10]|uniref:EscT/YscT/HrcT family type III secretion system export apparatus protein n=1 Tax=Ruegeria sp. SCP10 TaxID=3141377 RepID=UPI00333A837C